MVEEISADEYRAMIAGHGKRGNKYNAQKCQRDGIDFDSLVERRRYDELKLMQRGGLIDRLQVHPRFKLRGFTGMVIAQYSADFAYFDADTGMVVVEDVKSEATARNRTYRRSVKMLWDQTGIMVTQVMADGGGWTIRPAFRIPKGFADVHERNLTDDRTAITGAR